jgi:1-acyl-sn-glycerol-3-phosphate acyltransferase
MTALRSLVFNLCFSLWSVFIHLVALPALLAPGHWLWGIAHLWIRGMLLLLRVICGLGHRELGTENLPRGAAIIAAKHQSAWETLFLSLRLDRPSFILKRELLTIPVFSWYLRKMGMIAVDRSGGTAALKKMMREVGARFAEGRQIVIFPEGTRVAPGQCKPYHPGIAALYGQLKVPVVPVALNSGLYWGRKSFTKKPGEILIQYLPAIPPGLDRKRFMAELEARLEAAAQKLLTANQTSEVGSRKSEDRV